MKKRGKREGSKMKEKKEIERSMIEKWQIMKEKRKRERIKEVKKDRKEEK